MSRNHDINTVYCVLYCELQKLNDMKNNVLMFTAIIFGLHVFWNNIKTLIVCSLVCAQLSRRHGCNVWFKYRTSPEYINYWNWITKNMIGNRNIICIRYTLTFNVNGFYRDVTSKCSPPQKKKKNNLYYNNNYWKL